MEDKKIFIEIKEELFYKLISSSSLVYSKVGLIFGNICNLERAYLEVSKPKK